MKKIILLPFVFLSLASCKQNQKTGGASAEESKADQQVAELKIQLFEMQRELLEEQTLRLGKSSEQAALLSEMKGLLREVMDSDKEEPVMLSEAEKLAHENLEAGRVARLKAQGEEYATLETVSGEAYRELIISRVTDIGVVFRHEEGVGRVPFTDLTAAWQERFYYDEEKASRAQESENLAKLRHKSAAETRATEMDQLKKKMTDQKIDPASEVPQKDQIFVAPPIRLNNISSNGGGFCSFGSPHARVSKSPHVRTSNRTFSNFRRTRFNSGRRFSSFSRGHSGFRSNHFRKSIRSSHRGSSRRVPIIRR